jgi:UDP-glucose 4-epimerase
MVIPTFVGNALAGRPLEVHGDGTQTRCFCHVADTIQALRGLMDAREISGEIFNVGNSQQIRILDLAKRIIDLTGSRSRVELLPYDQVYGQGIEDMLHRIPSIEKISAAIGWQPSRPLEQILEDVLEYVRHAPVTTGNLAPAGDDGSAD